MEIQNLSDVEKKQLLEKLQKEEVEKRAAARLSYEQLRNEFVESYVKEFVKMQAQLIELKEKMSADADTIIQLLKDYGDAKSSQENFKIVADSGNVVEIASHNIMQYDERADIAAEKIKNFVKRRFKDEADADFILSLLQKRKESNEFDAQNIQTLYKNENRYDDAEWKEALELFRESYVIRGSKKYLRVLKVNELRKLVSIKLDFASL